MKSKYRLPVLSRFVIFILISMLALNSASPALAASLSQLQKQKQQAAAQAAAARKKAAQKQALANQLQVELNKLSAEIDRAQNRLNDTNSRISDTENNINVLNGQIQTEEDNLARENEKMASLVASWYMDGQSGLMDAIVRSDNISTAMDKHEAYDSIRNQIARLQNEINQTKANLDQQKTAQQKDLEMLEGMRNDQEAARQDLVASQSMKSRLLSNTVNALADLRAQEQAAQAQIGQIDSQIDTLTSTRSWGDGIVSSNDSSWYYTQIGNYTHLGDSTYTVHQYGCLITSMAMVATYYGHRITPTDIATNDSLFNGGGYLMVSSPPQLGVDIMPSRGIDWNVVDNELAAGRPVIVGILIPSVGAINNDGSSHYIVIKDKIGGKYLMHDPLGDGRSYSLSLVRSMKLVRP